MELTSLQKLILDKSCDGRDYWTLNENGEIDVNGNVDLNDILKDVKCKSLIELGLQFGEVRGNFRMANNNLTSLDGIPKVIKYDSEYAPYYPRISISGNNLTNYFKNIKEEDFPHWDKLYWDSVLTEYPFLVNRMMEVEDIEDSKFLINLHPQTKLYL